MAFMPTAARLAELRARSLEELLALTPESLTCRKCGETKPGTEFALDRNKPCGRTTDRCKVCTAEYGRWYRAEHPERVRESSRRSYAKTYETTARTYRLKKLYGLTRAEYDAMHAAQDGRCAICDREETALSNKADRVKGLSVDHCHDTGRIRGLLCGRCNSAIGLLNHDGALLRAAIAYLNRT